MITLNTQFKVGAQARKDGKEPQDQYNSMYMAGYWSEDHRIKKEEKRKKLTKSADGNSSVIHSIKEVGAIVDKLKRY